jgi:2,3-bisphosphoglycerate-dependent phosphoglycerate mutase
MMGDRIYLTFLRHGRTVADDKGIKEGHFDARLSDIGRNQVQIRAREFLSRELQFDYIISSTLQRAVETAQIIADALNMPVETNPEWMEKDIGLVTGMRLEEAIKKHPLPVFLDPFQPYFQTGESNWTLYCRAARALENIIHRGSGHYLIVAHGLIINAALRVIVGIQPTVNGQGSWFGFGDTGYIRIKYTPSEYKWIILEFKPN